MTEGFITQLLDFGALGLFAGFLIWLYVGTQRRTDAAHDRFTTSIDKINQDYDVRVEGMRERYGIVINDIRDKAQEQHKSYLESTSQIQQDLSDKLDTSIALLESIKASLDRAESSIKAVETTQKVRITAEALRKRKSSSNTADLTGELNKLATALIDDRDQD